MQNLTPASPAQNSGKKIVLIILGVAAVLIALLVVGGVSLYRSVSGTSKEAATAAGRFLDTLQAHDYKTAYATLTPQTQATTSAASVQDIQELLEKRHGRARGHSEAANWFVGTNNGVTTVRLTYSVQFEKGSVPVTLSLTPGNGTWRVVSYRFQI